MKVVGGWPGRRVVGLNGRFGVLPANIASLGDFPSPLLACVDPGDDNTEFVWVVESLPSAGNVTGNDDGGFSQVDPPDGTYTTTARLYTWAPGGPVVDRGTFIITTVFGSASTASGVTLVATVALLPGSASGGVGAPVFRPTGDISAGGWVATPSGPLWSAVDDAAPNLADFITGQVGTAGQAVFDIGPLEPGTYTWRFAADLNTGTAPIKARLFDSTGAQLCASPDVMLSTTTTTYEVTMSFPAGTAVRLSIEV